MKEYLKKYGFLTLVLLVALAFRLWGITWGYRMELNPDELHVFEVTSSLSFDDLDPHFYSYSGFTFYVYFFSSHLFEKLMHYDLLKDPLKTLFFYRLWSVLWGTVTVLLVYRLGRLIVGNRGMSVLGALFLAVLPVHIWNSHWATTDVHLALWTTFCLLFAVKAYRKPRLKYYLIGGLLAGFATGVKFNGSIAGISLLTAALLTFFQKGGYSGKKLVLFFSASVLAGFAGFFITSPYSIIHCRETLKAFSFEYHHTHHGHFGFDLTNCHKWEFHPFIYELFAMFPMSCGVALYIFFAVGLVYSGIKSFFPYFVILFSFFLVYFGIVASWTFVPMRYFLPLYPVFCVFAVFFTQRMVTLFPKTMLTFLLPVLLYTLLFSYTTTRRFSHDTRIEAAKWIDTHLEKGSRIVLVNPIFHNSYFPAPQEDRFDCSHLIAFHDLEEAADNYPFKVKDYLCLSGLSYQRFYRTGDPGLIRPWEKIRNNPKKFRLIKKFESNFLNKKFYMWLDPMYEGYFVSPTLELYQPVIP